MLRIRLAIFLLLTTSIANAREAAFHCAGSTVILLDSLHAAAVNSKPDAYTREHTSFDLAIRMNHQDASEEEYLNKAANGVRNWPESEVEQLKIVFASIDSFSRATGIKLHLPDTIKMIKTNGAEEFGAEGWTRENRIMLNTAREPIALHLVAHELWHVVSRYNKDLRNNAYAVFHFKPCNNIIYKSALQNRVITNPDCPYLMNYLTVQVNNQPRDVALVLYSKKDFQAGYSMEQFAAIGLLTLTGDDKHKMPLLEDGKPVILEIQAVPDLLKQIGTNTQYIIHIEEITAEHFAMLVAGEKMNQMEYVAGLKRALLK